MELTALKVKIKRDVSGNHLYPKFNDLQAVIDSGMDWAVYADKEGRGWCYDKQSGHDVHTNDSPFGEQWGVLLVPNDFATQAVSDFGSTCSIIDANDFETFHDEKVTAHIDEDIRQPDVLNAMAAELAILETLKKGGGTPRSSQRLTDLKTKLNKAVDPDDDKVAGVIKNKMKKWSDRKALQGISIRNP